MESVLETVFLIVRIHMWANTYANICIAIVEAHTHTHSFVVCTNIRMLAHATVYTIFTSAIIN